MKRISRDQSTRASIVHIGSTRRENAFREKSVILDAAVDEYLRLRREGKPVDADEFCARYPDYRNSLRRLIDVEEALPDFDQLDDYPWPEKGDVFLGYEIEGLLGAGSIARVFLASELKLGGRPVAIKVSAQGGYEAETLGKLRHPNIVEVYSVTYDESSTFTAVCMPYRGSATLSDVLDAAYRNQDPPKQASLISDVGRRMVVPDVLTEELAQPPDDPILTRGTYADGVMHLGLQLASALKYAHEHGVLHRDLKPSNVLLTPQGRPMLLDFNLSFDEEQNVVHRGGTLPYSAPEQLHEATHETQPTRTLVDARADVFSLGAILFELLTGKLPYGSPPPNIGPRQAIELQLQAHQQPLPPIRELNHDVDRYAAAIIEKCLAINPDDRYPNMVELEAALQEHFQKKRQVYRWIRRHPVLTSTVATITLVLTLLVAGYVISRPPLAQRAHTAGVIAFNSGDYPEAIRHWDAALGYRQNAYWYFLRGVAHQQLGNDDEAIADFKRARQSVDPDHPINEQIADLCAYSQISAKRTSEALLWLDVGIKANPDAAHLWWKKAFAIHFSPPRPIVPEDELNAALRLAPEDYEPRFLRAIMIARVETTNPEKLRLAAQDADYVAKVAPHLAVVELYLAEVHATAANFWPESDAKAKQHLIEAVNLGCSRKAIAKAISYSQLSERSWYDEVLDRGTSDSELDPDLKALIFPKPRPVNASVTNHLW